MLRRLLNWLRFLLSVSRVPSVLLIPFINLVLLIFRPKTWNLVRHS